MAQAALVATYDDFLVLRLADDGYTVTSAEAIHHGGHYIGRGRFLNSVSSDGTALFVGHSGGLIENWGVVFRVLQHAQTLDSCLVAPGRAWGGSPHTYGNAFDIWQTLIHDFIHTVVLTDAGYLIVNPIIYPAGTGWDYALAAEPFPSLNALEGPYPFIGDLGFNILVWGEGSNGTGSVSFDLVDSQWSGSAPFTFPEVSAAIDGGNFYTPSSGYAFGILHTGGLFAFASYGPPYFPPYPSWTASDLGYGGFTPNLAVSRGGAAMYSNASGVHIAARATSGEDMVFRFSTAFGSSLPPIHIPPIVDTHGVFAAVLPFEYVETSIPWLRQTQRDDAVRAHIASTSLGNEPSSGQRGQRSGQHGTYW